MARAARLHQAGYTPAETRAVGLSYRLPWSGSMAELVAAIADLKRDEMPDRGEAALRNAERFACWFRLEAERVRLFGVERAKRYSR